MTQYNLAMRVSYNGRDVSAGASRNARDLQQLTRQTQAQGVASARAAQQNNALSSSYRALAGAVSLYAAGRGVLGLVSDASRVELLNQRLRNLTGTAEQYAEVQAYLERTANRLNTQYSVLADSYARLLVLERQRTLSGEESRQILEGMTNVAKTLGATNTQLEQSLYGMSQALTQGRVQAQELNQVVEPLPGLLQAMDKAAGQSAGGFRRMVIDGQVTSEMFKTVLVQALQDYAGAAESTAGLISGASARFRSEYEKTLNALEQPINAAVVPVITTATEGLRLLANNVGVLEDLATAATLVAAVYGARLVGSLSAAAAAKVRNTISAQQQRVADLAAASAALASARAEQQAAAAYAASAVNIRTKVALQNQASAATARLTAATVTYTVAARAASVSTRLLSGAMALLGGPVGVVTLAALALVYYKDEILGGVTPTRDLRSEIDKLVESYKEMNAEGRQVQISKLTQDEIRARTQLIELQRRYRELERSNQANNTGNTNQFGGVGQAAQGAQQLAALRTQIGEAEALLNELAEKKAAVFNSTLPAITQQPQAAGSSNPLGNVDYNKEIAKITEALYTQEERIRASYERRKAILTNALQAEPEQRAKIDALLVKLEQQKTADLADLKRQQSEDALRLAREQREAELRGIEERYEAELRLLQGFGTRKAQLEFELQQRTFNYQIRNTGQMRGVLSNFSEWQIATEAEKTNAVLQLGQFGLQGFAQQSKKAFAIAKAFNIAQALVNTYQMATGAYQALVAIPIVGPALATAAAAAAVGFGLAQVQAIRKQQYQGVAHGGMDYVPQETTLRVARGERIVSPRQNVALNQAVARINQGQAGGNSIAVHYNPQYHIEQADDRSLAKLEAYEKRMQDRFIAEVSRQLATGHGPVYNAFRSAA